MATTPGERKALLFLSFLVLLGGGVRLWRTHERPSAAGTEFVDDATVDSAPSGAPPRAHRTHRARRATRRPSSRTRSRSDTPVRDSTTTIDADVATAADFDALGVLPGGAGRLIVADRDSFGPFGSLQELARVPFLTTAALRKLAPRVTFSRLPRPSNAVVRPPERGDTPTRRARRTAGHEGVMRAVGRASHRRSTFP